MKKNILRITAAFLLLISILSLFFYQKLTEFSYEEHSRNQIVALNEIMKLQEKLYDGDEYNIDSNNNEDSQKDQLATAVQKFKQDLRNAPGTQDRQEAISMLIGIYVMCVVFLLFVFGYIYYKLLRPFEKLKTYAAELAKGNFEARLTYERTNFFGDFTWAFDHMRREIKKARACEKEAMDNNKTVIATLSHDIKTPIASIRAYAEGLDANLDSNAERRRRYTGVIMKKCDEVTMLTNDLFLHSLADLDKLKMNLETVPMKGLLADILNELAGDSSDITVIGEIPKNLLYLDSNRFEQVIENLVNNARKYAEGTKIDVNVSSTLEEYVITIRDYGNGIPDEDLPFIFEKFYRGNNTADKPGAGLGLYIVKYIMEQLHGTVSLQNLSEGLEVTLALPLKIS